MPRNPRKRPRSSNTGLPDKDQWTSSWLAGRTITSEKGTLIVSAGGHVEANVAVATAKINGTVNGDIYATERIEFGRTARVRGNIQTPALVVEEGAVFEGGCRMTSKQPAQEKPRPAAAAPPPSAPKTAGVAEAAG